MSDTEIIIEENSGAEEPQEQYEPIPPIRPVRVPTKGSDVKPLKTRKALSEESKQIRRDLLVKARAAKKEKEERNKQILAQHYQTQKDNEIARAERKQAKRGKHSKRYEPESDSDDSYSEYSDEEDVPIEQPKKKYQSSRSHAPPPKTARKRTSKQSETQAKLEALEQRLNDILSMSKGSGKTAPRIIKKTTVIQQPPVMAPYNFNIPQNNHSHAPKQSEENKNNLKKIISMFN